MALLQDALASIADDLLGDVVLVLTDGEQLRRVHVAPLLLDDLPELVLARIDRVKTVGELAVPTTNGRHKRSSHAAVLKVECRLSR
eukprot:COSAG02_NODE_26151_length_639_cov_1.855556_1_plen_85_part_10